MKLHTIRSLYDKWEDIYNNKRERTKKLQEKQKLTNINDDQEQERLHWEIQELLTESNVIHQMLADLGLMVYVEENRK